MMKADKKKFDMAMVTLAVATREKISEDVLEVYFKALEDVEIESAVAAIGNLTKTAKFFPKVGEIRELAKPVIPPYRQKYFNGEKVLEEKKQIGTATKHPIERPRSPQVKSLGVD